MMSNPKIQKDKNVKTRQTVMGEFFSKNTSPKKSQKKATSTEKVTKKVQERKLSPNKRKAVEKKKAEAVEETKVAVTDTKETVEKAERSVEKTKAVSKKGEKGIEKRPSLKRKVTGAGMFSFSWTRGAQRDTEAYRNGYPGKEDHAGYDDNYKFYTNQIPSKPDGDFIDGIHVNWWGDYKLLEVHHGYIQWLFPIRESGLNWHAQELQLHEIKKIQRNRKAMKRLLTSYKMMLDFYGMELENEEDGTIKRAENWRDRFRHLNKSYHNYLRITRILKCLGEFGYEYLKKNFVKFILYEGLEEGTLSNLIDSCVKYWIGVLKDDDEREEMFDYYEKLASDENLFAKRRNRSPSPPSSIWSKEKNDSETRKNKSKLSEKDDAEKEKEKKNGNDFSDQEEEDSTLSYAMKLIDDDSDDDDDVQGKKAGMEKKVKGVQRKEHELSDSDKEEESQEMQHWKNEGRTSNQEEIENSSELYESTEETESKSNESNKISDSVDEKPKDVEREVTNSEDSLVNGETQQALETKTDEKETKKKEETADKGREETGENEDVPNNDVNDNTEVENDLKADLINLDAEENKGNGSELSTKPEEMDTSENTDLEQIANENVEMKVEDVSDGITSEIQEKHDEEENMET